MIKLLNKDWYEFLEEEFVSSYFKELWNFIQKDKKLFTIYPPEEKIFEAFNKCPLDKLKVIIIGQDPYHGKGQANGLAFSVDNNLVRKPPSLLNIFHELLSDLLIPRHNSDLSDWANQGVLLLNSILTVRSHLPASHKNKGWEQFTDTVIRKISEIKENLVFMLWGQYAQSKRELIRQKGVAPYPQRSHLIFEAAHPSPFSVKEFFGCKHFSKCNKFLIDTNQEPINW